MEARR